MIFKYQKYLCAAESMELAFYNPDGWLTGSTAVDDKDLNGFQREGGRCELYQVEGREKRLNYNKFEIASNLPKCKKKSSLWEVLHDIYMVLIYNLHDYFIYRVCIL